MDQNQISIDIQIAAMNAACESRQILLKAFHRKSTNRNDCLIDFCRKFIDLISLLNPTTDSKKHHEYIFTPNPDFKRVDVINAHLITAKEYALDVIEKVSPKIEEDFSICLIGALFDFQKILEGLELTIPYLKYTGENGNRNMQVDSYASFKVAKHIFNGPVNDLYSLNGFAIFAIRQSIESASKEILGLGVVKEDLGNGIYKDYYNSQLPLKYLASRKFDPNFKFNCDPMDMYRIYKWSNDFVHTGKNSLGYIVFLALKILSKLYDVDTTYNCYSIWGFNRCTVIYNYDLIQADFENYTQKQDKDKTLKVFWSSRIQTLSNKFLQIHTPIIKTKEYIINAIKQEIKTHSGRSSVLNIEKYNYYPLPEFTINFKGKIYEIVITDFVNGIFIKVYPPCRSKVLIDQIYVDISMPYVSTKISAHISNDFSTIRNGNHFWETFIDYTPKAYMKEFFKRLKNDNINNVFGNDIN